MSIDVEYAIKKDIRNNPVIREVDALQRREIWRTVRLAAVIVAVVLFAALQHYRVVDDGYGIERLRAEIAAEQTANRQLRLNLAASGALTRIEDRARQELGLAQASPKETLVIERAHRASPTGAVVAQAH